MSHGIFEEEAVLNRWQRGCHGEGLLGLKAGHLDITFRVEGGYSKQQYVSSL